jgi:hypothetical protein
MKSLIKKIGVFVMALAFMVSTASAVLADWSPSEDDPEGRYGQKPPGWSPGNG